jgi:hypothetical protein
LEQIEKGYTEGNPGIDSSVILEQIEKRHIEGTTGTDSIMALYKLVLDTKQYVTALKH